MTFKNIYDIVKWSEMIIVLLVISFQIILMSCEKTPIKTVFFYIILNSVGIRDALVELPQVADNEILKTELVIRSTANKLFTNIKLKGVKNYPRLKQYGLIHNYFVSLTLKDHKNLEEIAKLTRVDKKTIDNSSVNFIEWINEILNEDSFDFETKSKTSLRDVINDKIVSQIDDYNHIIAYLKETYGDSTSRFNINKEIIHILENNDRVLNRTAFKELDNYVSSNNDTLLNDNEFWVPDSSSRRIYQGQATKIKNFPFMASVHFFNNFQCGGSIIKNDLVITAASCLTLAWNNRLYRENPGFLTVGVGSSYYKGEGESISVLEIYFYPTYNPKTLKNNIAIMRLARRIKFKGKKKSNVKKIDIDSSDSPLPTNVHSGITIVGWGAKTHSNIIHNPWENRLSFAVLDVYPLRDCMKIYSQHFVTQKNFCAGFISKGGGACIGDVGGPGIVSGVLTGIISFGSPVCGKPSAPTVFTKVGYYADWIEEIMEQNSGIPVSYKRTTKNAHFTIITPIDRSPIKTTMKPTFTDPYPEKTSFISVFKQFLNTMFDGLEIKEYLDLADYEKDSNQNNAEYIGSYKHHMLGVGYDQVTPVVNVDSMKLQYSYTTSATDSEKSVQALDYAPEVDDIKIFNAESENSDDLSLQEKSEFSNQLESKSAENIKTKDQIESKIMKLIDNVNLKQKIAEEEKKANILDKDPDNTILTLLNIPDPEKREGGEKSASGNNQVGDDNNANYKNEAYNNKNDKSNYVDAGDNNIENNFEINYYHQEFGVDSGTQSGEANEMPQTEETADSFKKDFNDKKARNESVFNIFSKQILLDIVSRVIEYKNRNMVKLMHEFGRKNI